jgi:hypothetical protein
MKYFVLFTILICCFGCVSTGVLRIENSEDSSLEIKRLLEESSLKINDKQFVFYSKSLRADDVYIRYHVNETVKEFKNSIVVSLDECILEKRFYENPATLLSLISFTIIPVRNTYSCKSRIVVTDIVSQKTSEYYFDQNYIIAFGIVIFPFGLFDSLEVGYVKRNSVDNLLFEVVKNGQ